MAVQSNFPIRISYDDVWMLEDLSCVLCYEKSPQLTETDRPVSPADTEDLSQSSCRGNSIKPPQH